MLRQFLNLSRSAPTVPQITGQSFSSILGNFSATFPVPLLTSPGGCWSTIFNRTNVRNHFPRAKETKRVQVHGWKKRLTTEGGRKIIMRRILKGNHVLTH